MLSRKHSELTASVARRRLPTAAWLAATWLALGAAGAAAQQDQLDANRTLWDRAAIDAYEYGYNKYCECHRESPPETVVTVRGGEVVRVRHRHTGTSAEVEAEPRNLQWYWTVEGLFDLVGSALNSAAVVRAEYDSLRGHPTSVYIDYDADLIGDEVDVRLTRLEPLTQ